MEGWDHNGAWRRHHEMIDDVVRYFRPRLPSFMSVRHDGEQLVFL